MAIGSDVEDNKVPPIDGGGYRSLNHFYDPLDNTYGKGQGQVSLLTIDTSRASWEAFKAQAP
jgi:hypothetical protein